MASAFNPTQLQEMLVYPFRDRDWRAKLSIAGLLAIASYIVPVVPWLLLLGYYARVMRRIIVGDGQACLPKWDNWGELLLDGLRLLGVRLIYALPVFMLLFAACAGLIAPVLIVPALFWSSAEPLCESVPAVCEVVPPLGMLGGFVLLILATLSGVVVGWFAPVIMGHVVARGEFAAGFRFRGWWNILRANLGGFAVAYVIAMGLGMVPTVVMQVLYMTLILCWLVPLLLPLVGVYTSLVSYALYAQAYRVGAERTANRSGAIEAREEKPQVNAA